MLYLAHNELPEGIRLSTTLLSNWLFTRKTSRNYGGFTIPGLFSTRLPVFDVFCFVVILGLEIYGLINLNAVGVSFEYLIGFFIADFLFAILLHLPRKKIYLFQNKLRFENYNTPRFIKFNNSIRIRVFFQIISALIIISIAIIKIIGFYTLHGGVFDGIVLAIILSYAIVALLHIISTGYFLSYIFFSLFLQIEVNKFSKGTYITEPSGEELENRQSIQSIMLTDEPLEEIKVNGHNLIKEEVEKIIDENTVKLKSQSEGISPNDNEEKQAISKAFNKLGNLYAYNLKISGVFLDDHLFRMIEGQKGRKKKQFLLASRGLQLQLSLGGFDEN